MFASPAQNATPPRAGSPLRSYAHSSLPVSGSRATRRLFVVRYIVPFTTIGVISVPPVMPSARTLPTLYSHARVSCPAFLAEIWASGEKRVPPRSRLYIGHSAAEFFEEFLIWA